MGETIEAKKATAWARLDAKLEKKIPEFWKFIKFSVAGGLSSAVELGVAALLQYVIFKAIEHEPIPATGFFKSLLDLIGMSDGLGIFYSYIISITVGYTIAYILNRKVSFKADSNMALSTFLYVLMVVFTILAGAWIGTSLNEVFAAHGWEKWSFLIKIFQMFISTAWTYPINRFIIHRHKKAKAEPVAATESAQGTE
jgi:putative flippase GtrA